ncbi:hypothetical protein VAE151_560128 [Vibrio aestuarianus]|uniref:Uncharacterized protein n=1 Tax=Vibrio aestuarianus TaxID=28171 RepID=A0ABN8TVB5_9VIBR|nr:hypothetical protein VAE308_1050776 [Vibrio aestuarianus]CAH8200708.1 hypothetical protein VIBAE_A31368 [Vibrio aestuarianus subsp. francensis]CAH8201241.1 hypothetical protein VAE055_380128 [Vibrio aestuarianus]CAH8201357.1 hypothetical protein VAE032_270772 [Vibrio aestuarianus]CAH8201475.1 hypothetical protein VAE128_460777 [Vibrio aestuarianus]
MFMLYDEQITPKPKGNIMTKSVILLNRYELSKRVMSDKANAQEEIVWS